MLVTNQQTQNLGRVRFGKPIEFTFQIENTGLDPIIIHKLYVGCASCTSASANKTALRRGESSTINATFTPGSLGPQKKTITVRYHHGDFSAPMENLKLEFIAESYAEH